MQLAHFLKTHNKYFLRASGILGFILGLIYFPGTPVYILGTLLGESEIGIWASCMMGLSVVVFLSSFSSAKSLKGINIIILTATIVLNIAALITYKSFLPEALVGEPISLTGIDVAFVHLEWTLVHMLFIAIAGISIVSDISVILPSAEGKMKKGTA